MCYCLLELPEKSVQTRWPKQQKFIVYNSGGCKSETMVSAGSVLSKDCDGRLHSGPFSVAYRWPS